MAASSAAPRRTRSPETTVRVAVWKKVAAVAVIAAVAAGGIAGTASSEPAQVAPVTPVAPVASDGSSPAADGIRPAADGGQLRPGSTAYLRKRTTEAEAQVPERSLPPQRVSAVSSTFVVTYHGFPTAARASFQRAVDLWSKLVSSSVPIRIDATWKSMEPLVLGGAGPADFYRGGTRWAWQPIAMANAAAKRDLSPEPDIIAEFNKDGGPWYFGTDGNTPANQMDFTTVVLHEIGHGLGLVDSTEVSGGRGSFGYGTGYPFEYDAWVADSAGGTILDYGSGTTALAAMLRSNKVYWGGSAVDSAHRTKLYAPSTFRPGSSISHLDEATYPTGNANSLMTPYLDDGESIYDPGDLVLMMVRDMGWKTVGAAGVPGSSTAPSGSAGTGRVDLSWTPPIDTGRVRLTGTRIYRYDDGAATPAQTYDVPASATSYAVTGLANGTSYRFAVAASNSYGLGARSPLSPVMVPFDSSPFTNASGIVRRQYLDFVGRQPNLGELNLFRTGLNDGSAGPADVVAAVASLPESADLRAKVTRLYSAYFQRLPDYGGFQYWTGRLRSGTSLQKASDTFAASSEFRRTYGSLSNRAFVKLVYTNVLHRAPDTSGLNYWVSRLDRRVQGRGSVMTQFSESSENVRKMAAEVQSVLLRSGMLHRMPTKPEYTADQALLDGGSPLAALAGQIYATTEYRDLVS